MTTENDILAQKAYALPRFSASLAIARKPSKRVVFLPPADLRVVDGVQEVHLADGRWTPTVVNDTAPVFVATGTMPPVQHLDVVISLIGVMPIPGPVGLDGKERTELGEFAELWRGSVDDLRAVFGGVKS
jgi:hypothetical protein